MQIPEDWYYFSRLGEPTGIDPIAGIREADGFSVVGDASNAPVGEIPVPATNSPLT